MPNDKCSLCKGDGIAIVARPCIACDAGKRLMAHEPAPATCSEVVERLAKCVNEFGPVLAKEWAENIVSSIGPVGTVWHTDAAISLIQRALLDFAAMRQFDHTKASAILHEWREGGGSHGE